MITVLHMRVVEADLARSLRVHDHESVAKSLCLLNGVRAGVIPATREARAQAGDLEDIYSAPVA